MEIIEIIGVPYFKKGNRIRIKKKNRGKFTLYCDGKVTQECIDKAKKSKNPKLRKRATFADNARKWKHLNGGSLYSAGNVVNTLYENNDVHEKLGTPWHKYDFTLTEEWADAHGYFPDERGHRDDRVKKETHPSHPSRGSWNKLGTQFQLTEKGMEDPNHTLFGLADGGLDPLATLYYKNGIVLPEITVTPNESYIHNTYDNIKLSSKHQYGGSVQPWRIVANPRETEIDRWIESKAKPFIKKVAHKINEHGKLLVSRDPAMFPGFDEAVIDKANAMGWNGERLGETRKEHKQAVKNLLIEANKDSHTAPRSLKAAQASLVGTALGTLGPWGKVAGSVLSVPDVVYDWAASIDEPSLSNHAHTATNHLESLAGLTHTKYDDVVAKGLSIISNTDDAVSAVGKDMYAPVLKHLFGGKTTFHSNWLNLRIPILAKNAEVSEEKAELIAKKQIENLKKTPEYVYNSPLFYKKLSIEDLFDADNAFIDGASALYDTQGKFIVYGDLYTKEFSKEHERTHATDPVEQETAISKYKNEKRKIFKNPKLKYDRYLDSSTEIYARLMLARKDYKLDPTKTYTKDDLKTIKENIEKDFEEDSSYIFNRYDDEFILHLLNDIAYNDSPNETMPNLA